MSARRIPSIFSRFACVEINAVFLKDKAKRLLVVGEFALKLMNLWPEQREISNTMWYFFMVTLTGVHVLFTYFCLSGSSDMNYIVNIVAFSNPGLQVIIKSTVLFSWRKELSTVFTTMKHNFWPSNLTESATENRISLDSKRAIIFLLIEFISAFFVNGSLITIHLLRGGRSLLFEYCVPFDWTKSPIYETLYVFQLAVVVCIPFGIIVSCDLLFAGLCSNCSAQFRLLRSTIKIIGTGKEEDMIRKLLILPAVKFDAKKEWGKEKMLLVICVKHHQKLIGVTDALNKIFGIGMSMQLALSLCGICNVCYQFVHETDTMKSAALLIFYLVYICQLLWVCSTSNNLNHLSTCIGDGAYESLCCNKKYTDIRKCLMLVILRSQRPVSMNAFGFFELNYISFVAVVRFSFSLYAFLSKM